MSNQFISYKYNGIKHQYTQPRTWTQQNKVNERMNMSLLDKIRLRMHELRNQFAQKKRGD
jgi:hypothetical protein